MIETIESTLNSMGQRKILFVIGEHLSGKTKLVKEFLKKHYGNSYSQYVDVGLYIKSKINNIYLEKYKTYPDEFIEDAEDFFNELIEEKYKDNKLIVFDHMEFLMSEKYIGWIKLLDKVTTKDSIAIVVVPNEYVKSLPLQAYRHIIV